MSQFSDPVPLIQVIGLCTNEWCKDAESYLSEKGVPFAALDCAVFAATECRSENQSALITWKFTCFTKQLLHSASSAFPLESHRIAKLKKHEIHNCLDFVHLVHSITKTTVGYTEENGIRCVVLLIKDYQALLSHEHSLFNTLLRIHEKLSRFPATESLCDKKVVVVFVGPHPIPPEVTKGDFAIPLIQLSVSDQNGLTDRIGTKNLDYAIQKAQEQVHGISTDNAEFLWKGFVQYFVGTVYPWYKTDPLSMELYCRMLWMIFLEPLQGSELPGDNDLDDCLHHLCKSVDIHINNITKHCRSRFTSELFNSAVSETFIQRKRLDKFNGSRLSKYLLIGAAISTMCHPYQIRRRLRKLKVRDIGSDGAFWRRRHRFEFWSWIANTEWVYASNEGEGIKLDHILYDQMLWVISEGYVKPLSNISLWRRLPASRSAALWHVTDTPPSADQPWRDFMLQNRNIGSNSYLGHIMCASARFIFCAPKDLILSIVKDLSIDMDQFFF
uniref:Uncharacterized protein n=1 Tax=Babesia bovis TaxID=5865 RepID=A7AVX9_BABBO|eukprot:XP_001609523.1 hypothetical protein [Babesia bovis T2Bo]